MARKYTRPLDAFECRLAGNCRAQDWFYAHTGNFSEYLCDDCPFMELINAFAEAEDYLEKTEDDLK